MEFFLQRKTNDSFLQQQNINKCVHSMCCQCHTGFLTSNIHRSIFGSLELLRYGVINEYKCKQNIFEFSKEFDFIQTVSERKAQKVYDKANVWG